MVPITAAIKLVRDIENHCGIIGFAGSPWTLASFMVEGGSSRDNLSSRAFIHEQPILTLMSVTAQSTI